MRARQALLRCIITVSASSLFAVAIFALCGITAFTTVFFTILLSPIYVVAIQYVHKNGKDQATALRIMGYCLLAVYGVMFLSGFFFARPFFVLTDRELFYGSYVTLSLFLVILECILFYLGAWGIPVFFLLFIIAYRKLIWLDDIQNGFDQAGEAVVHFILKHAVPFFGLGMPFFLILSALLIAWACYRVGSRIAAGAVLAACATGFIVFSEPFALSLQAKQAVAKQGTDIPILITLTNHWATITSTKPLSDPSEPKIDYAITVDGEAGSKTVHDVYTGGTNREMLSLLPKYKRQERRFGFLPPGRRLQDEVMLNKHYPFMLSPGKYVIRVQSGGVKSNPLNVEITP